MARIVVFVNDLLLGSKIREAVARSGHEGVYCSSQASLTDALSKGPADLVLADLSPRGADPLPALAELKSGVLADVPVVGYFSHVDATMRDRAAQARIEAHPRSAFFGDLPGLLTRALAR